MKITIYTTTDCQFSKQEKDYLTAHNLPFEEKNLETNREFLTEMLAVSNNFAGTPVTVLEDEATHEKKVLKGFTQSEFDEALHLTPAVPAAAATTPVAPAAELHDTPLPPEPTPAGSPAMPMSPNPTMTPEPMTPEPMTPPAGMPSPTPMAPSMPSEPAAPIMPEAPKTETPQDMSGSMSGTQLPPLDIPASTPSTPAPAAPIEPPAAMPPMSEPTPEPAAPVTPPPAAPTMPAPAEQNKALDSILNSLQDNMNPQPQQPNSNNQ